jgi:hypothetical protein
MSTQLRLDRASTAEVIIGVKTVVKSQPYVKSVEEKVIFKNFVIEYHRIREEKIDQIKDKTIEKHMNVIWAINIDLTKKVFKRRMTGVRRTKELLRPQLIFVVTRTRVQENSLQDEGE